MSFSHGAAYTSAGSDLKSDVPLVDMCKFKIIACRDKIACLERTRVAMSQHDCFDDDDKAWVTDSIVKTTLVLRELMAYETQVISLQQTLDQRMHVLSQIQEETDLLTHDRDLFQRFVHKQSELTKMVANQPIPTSVLGQLSQ